MKIKFPIPIILMASLLVFSCRNELSNDDSQSVSPFDLPTEVIGCQFHHFDSDQVSFRQRQFSNVQLWNPCQKVYICIEDCFEDIHNDGITPLPYTERIETAVEMINGVSETSLRLQIIDCDNDDGLDPDIIIQCGQIGASCVIGSAPIFSGQQRINLVEGGLAAVLAPCCGDMWDNATLEEQNCLKLGTALHEILHAIGMAHTDDQNETHIPGTPIIDTNSILWNDFPTTESWCESLFELCSLSEGDIAGIQALYPPIDFQCECFGAPQFPIYNSNVCVGDEWSIVLNPINFENLTFNVAVSSGNTFQYDTLTGVFWSNLTNPGSVIINFEWEACGESYFRTVFLNVTNLGC